MTPGSGSVWSRIENGLLGGTILFWSLWAARDLQVLRSPVHAGILALNVSVGVLIVLRSVAVVHGSWQAAAVALPSVGMGFLACRLAPDPQSWPPVAQGMFVAGCFVAMAAFLTLGRSFAVLPSVRTIVRRGPYRLVRHPAYVGELLLAAACVVARPSWLTSLPILLAIPLTILRIQVEERLLLTTPEYADYRTQVRSRLLPGIW